MLAVLDPEDIVVLANHGCLGSSRDVELLARVVDMKIDGPFGQLEDLGNLDRLLPRATRSASRSYGH